MVSDVREDRLRFMFDAVEHGQLGHMYARGSGASHLRGCIPWLCWRSLVLRFLVVGLRFFMIVRIVLFRLGMWRGLLRERAR